MLKARLSGAPEKTHEATGKRSAPERSPQCVVHKASDSSKKIGLLGRRRSVMWTFFIKFKAHGELRHSRVLLVKITTKIGRVGPAEVRRTS